MDGRAVGGPSTASTEPRPADPEPFARLPRNIRPLGYRNYALFWLGFLATNAGRWIELAGTVWLVYELTKSPFHLGLVGLARAAPTIALSPIGGVIADRVDQRRLLSITQLLGFLASLTLGLLIVSGRVEVWHVYVQVLVQSTIMAFDASVRHALFPRLVPKAAIPEAVALSVIAGRVSKMLGPAIGGVSIAVAGEAAPFLLNAGSFLVLVTAVRAMDYVVPRKPVVGATIRGDLVAGLRFMASDPVLSGLLKMELVFGIFQLNPVIITIIGREGLNVSAEGLGGLLAAPALGALVGIGGLLVFGQSIRPGRFVVISSLIYATTLATVLLANSYLATFGLLVTVGLFDSFLAVTRQSVMQVAAPGRMRGRIMANVGAVTRGFSPLAEAQSGFMIGIFGPAVAISVAASMIALNGVTARLTNPTLWRYRFVRTIERESVVGAIRAPEGSTSE